MSVQRGCQSDQFLKLSHDRKVSPRGVYQASRDRWIATVPNSFGLPAGISCPGKTSFCTSCYAVNSEKSAGVEELVTGNLALLQAARTESGMYLLLAQMLRRYRDEADRLKLPARDLMFRIHWDGDFFSLDYARAWARAIRQHPDVQFWCYTRSFVEPVNVVPILADLANLVLYLSVDGDNATAAHAQVGQHPGVLLALCAADYATARDLGAGRPSLICPENAERLPLMADGRGACVECRLCPDGKRDVLFSTSHREDIMIPPPTLRRRNPAPAAPADAESTVCGNPACNVTFMRERKRGRPRIYCSDDCRWAVSRLRAAVNA